MPESAPVCASAASTIPDITASRDTDTTVRDTDTTVSTSSDISMDDAPVHAVGRQSLPMGPGLKPMFLDVDTAVSRLRDTDNDAFDYTPHGIKENQYFIIDNANNVDRRRSGLQSQFWDDCGSWVGGGPSNKTIFLSVPGQRLKKVVFKNGQYCLERQRNKATVHIPVEPQPDPTNILTVRRYYAKHSVSPSYEKRVTWIEDASGPHCAIYEYRGQFPGLAPHGKATAANSDKYVRLKPHVMEQLKTRTRTAKPIQVYHECDPVDGPRNRRIVREAKYRERKKERQTGTNRGNFADHMQNLDIQLQNNTFVQQVIRNKDKVPSIILHTEQQILDIKRFCCSAPLGQTTVLGFDKTFNLGDVYLTLGMFKNIAVKRRDTGDHPIFAGPMLLHGNSGYHIYRQFFQHLATELENAPSQPVTGTDLELTMVKAIKTAFPNGGHLSCA